MDLLWRMSRRRSSCLCLCRFFGFGCFGGLSALAQFCLLALCTACITFGPGDDIDDDTAVVFAAAWAGPVRDAQRPAIAGGNPGAGNCMVRAPLGGLGAISAHSYNHRVGILYSFYTNTQSRAEARPMEAGETRLHDCAAVGERAVAFVFMEMVCGIFE